MLLINWGFNIYIKNAPVFIDKNVGFLHVLGSLFAEHKLSGMLTKIHNCLSMNDIKIKFSSHSCTASTKNGYLNRLVLTFALSLDLLLAAMYELTLDQFYSTSLDGDRVLVYEETLGLDMAHLRLDEVEFW